MSFDLDEARRFFALAPFMVELGITPTHAGSGTMTTELTIAQHHLQHIGQVHAGVMATIADHTMGAAAQTLAAPGTWVVTAEFKTSLLRAAKGERLVCEARVLKPGRQISFTEAEVYAVTGDERTLVAKASATMAVTTPR